MSSRCGSPIKLAPALSLPPGHDASDQAPGCARLALALALTFFAMFLFRRWYAFAAVGIAVTLALEVAAIALAARRKISAGARRCWPPRPAR